MNGDKVFHGLDSDINYVMECPEPEGSISFLEMRCAEYNDPEYQMAIIREMTRRLVEMSQSRKKMKRAVKRLSKIMEGDRS